MDLETARLLGPSATQLERFGLFRKNNQNKQKITYENK
jgi:hypothetical protein